MSSEISTNVVMPKFMTSKYSITKINTLFNIMDYELRYHSLNKKNLYITDKCSHNLHKHNRDLCYLTTNSLCLVCHKPNRLLINYENLMCHIGELLDVKELYKLTCCTHVHVKPCKYCLPCNTIEKSYCMLSDNIECNLTTNVLCNIHQKFTQPFDDKNILSGRKIFIKEHIYDILNISFWLCQRHAHTHTEDNTKKCILQSYQCCDEAIEMHKFPSTFIITVYTEHLKKNVSYTIYDTRVWREQSKNHFNSFIKAVIVKPSVAHTRYERFENLSNFTISDIKRYISGKESAARTIITGFETQGLYQTATISCSLKHFEILIPQNLWDRLVDGRYDTSYFIIKRDPSFKSTCLYVVYGHRSPDPTNNTIVISDFLSKPLHQDVDGDKNCIYLYPLTTKNGYDSRQSYRFVVSKIEMGCALGKMVTTIATPRYQLSETNILLLYKYREWLKSNCPQPSVFGGADNRPLEFVRRTFDRNLE